VLLLWRGWSPASPVWIKRPDSVGGVRFLLSQKASVKSLPLVSVPAQLQINGQNQQVLAFIDSGADTEFLDVELARSLNIELRPTSTKLDVLALDGHVLHRITQETFPVKLIVGGNHHD